MERTLVVLKPDAIQRGFAGEILTRFERVGLKIVAAKMVSPDKDFFHYHYEDIGKMISRRGEEAFNVQLDLMQLGPVLALVLEGVEAAEVVRKMTGATEPKSATPGTIRGDYAHISFNYANTNKKGVPTLIHASGDADEAKKEIKHWFNEEEIYNYESSHDKHTK